MRYNVGRYVVLLMVIIGLCGGMVMSLGANTGAEAATQTLETQAWGTDMTLGQWRLERASEAQEDTNAWDCRVMGNAQCGDTWYELVCPDAPQVSTLLCSLEPHKALATRYV